MKNVTPKQIVAQLYVANNLGHIPLLKCDTKLTCLMDNYGHDLINLLHHEDAI